ncbi:DUF2971 domain-containing protein [Shewanella sp. YLB-09]|nr:DUF2971 domain-containing protein [Shewanella sp. YLB-09]
MLRLYKYMSEDVALKFIKKPLLRLTPNWALNDPFECKVASTTNQKLNILDGNVERSIHTADFMGLHGIVSLSETPDNLLMWSHYADEHKGAVVEFLIEGADPLDMFNIGKCPTSSDAILGKVNYRKRRNYPFSVDVQSLDSIRTHYYLTKSDEWIYEKEHRFIIPGTEASYMRSSNQGLYSDLELNNEGLDNFTLIQSVDTKQNLWKYSKETQDMFFMDVHPRAIGRFIIGCNGDLDLYKKAMKEGELSGLGKTFASSVFNKFCDVEVSKIHPERFELTFEPLMDQVNNS